jgi:hypothetical protein
MIKFGTAVFIFFFSLNLWAQDVPSIPKHVYRIGAGAVIDGNAGYLGLNFTNEFSYYFADRLSINPTITFFSSLTDFEGRYHSPLLDGMENNEFSSGLFTDVKLRFDILKFPKDNFRLGIAVGPSLQIGGEAWTRGFTQGQDGEMVSMGYHVERHRRLGYVSQVSFEWQKPESRIRHFVGVGMQSYSGYWPYYLMVNYQIGITW